MQRERDRRYSFKHTVMRDTSFVHVTMLSCTCVHVLIHVPLGALFSRATNFARRNYAGIYFAFPQ